MSAPAATLSSKHIARQSRSNLAFALACLPRERKNDMISFYAFCRIVDDIADDPEAPVAERQRELDAWKAAIMRGDGTLHPLLAETIPLAAKYGFDPALLIEIIDGVASDLTRDRYETLPDLLGYCYKVASVVGLVSIHIFGHRDPACHDYAVNLGYALQLTNILRDVGQDARDTRRIYLPLEDLRAHGVTEEQILAGQSNEAFLRLMDTFYQHARRYFDLAASQLPRAERRNMIAAEMMAQVYSEILEKLRRNGFQVFARRERLHPLRKGAILASYLLRGLIGMV